MLHENEILRGENTLTQLSESTWIVRAYAQAIRPECMAKHIEDLYLTLALYSSLRVWLELAVAFNVYI